LTNRIVSCALIRDGETHSRGFKEHWQIRAALGDTDPYQKKMTDEYGFLDSLGVFHDRYEAIPIAVDAGQLNARWLELPRELLSSDLNWDALPPPDKKWDYSSDARPRPEHHTPPIKESRQVRRARERKQR
jgi:hypothetical protein